MIPGTTCVTCICFCRSRPPHDHSGQCRHDPPKLSFAKDKIRTIWPLVHVDDWCAQHMTMEEQSK